MMALLPTSFKGLTPELIKKAEIELNETHQVKTRALSEFKKLIKEEKNLNCRPDDIFLTRFLRVTKYDVERSMKVLRNYYNFQNKHSGTFTHIKPSELKNDFETNVIYYPPYRVEDGSHITILRISNYITSITPPERLVALILLWGEIIMECEASQISGANLIVDLQESSFEKYKTFLTIQFIKFMYDALTESWPLRIRGIHILHEPYTLHVIYNTVKHFMKKKLTDKIHFHGSDYESLFKYVPKYLLPEELGGTLGPMDSNEQKNFFFSQEVFIEEINKYGIIRKAS